jgi:Tetratricopeptide repeat
MEKKQSRLNNEAEQIVSDGLAWLRLESDIQKAAMARKVQARRRSVWRWGGVMLCLLLAGTGCFFYAYSRRASSESPIENTMPPPTQNTPQTIDNQPFNEPNPARKVPPNKPIAQNKPAESHPNSRYNQPTVRGSNSPTDAVRKALLNDIGHTDYPIGALQVGSNFSAVDQALRNGDVEEAYLNLQRLERKSPDNDTLHLLKGYCLLEMGEGAAALDYLRPLAARHPDWQPTLDWQAALALLWSGMDAEAKRQFQRISNTPNHPYQVRSQSVIKALEK